MEKHNKKKALSYINEELLMKLMVDGVKKEGLPLDIQPEIKPEGFTSEIPTLHKKNQTKKNTQGDYGAYFLRTHSMNKRGEKTIYIRQEYHERLSRIIQAIGKDQIPMYAYLDNILEHHFKLFEKEITNDFNENFKPIF